MHSLTPIPSYVPGGAVYLMHLWPPYKHARHYRGWSERPKARLAANAAGCGAKLPAAARAAGCDFVVVSVTPGSRTDERCAKKRKNAPRECPVCQAFPLIALSAFRRLVRSRRLYRPARVAWWVWLPFVLSAASLIARPHPGAVRRADDPPWFIPF